MLVEHGQPNIDTARVYSEGTSEKVMWRTPIPTLLLRNRPQFLSQLDLKSARVDTKIFPREPGQHSPEKLRQTFKLSLEALGDIKIRVYYLHGPDRSVPYEETLEAINDLYKQGLL